METEMELDDVPTRQSSKFSLGSSLSVLSADEQLDGEGPLTPTDKIQDGDDDDMSELNSLIDSTGTLSNAEVTDDEDMLLDDHSEHDSASPLSSIPDDFPLSRSASPELNEQETSEEKESLQEENAVFKQNEVAPSKKEKLQVEEDEEEDQDAEDEEEETAPVGTTSTRGRRKEAITRQQKLKQQKQKDSSTMVKSAVSQVKDKENEKETGSRRKRGKKESPSDKAEETKAKKQRTSEPKSRKGLNKQQRKEKQIEEEEEEDDDDDEQEMEDEREDDEEKKEEAKVEEGENKTEGEQVHEDESEKETPAESSSNNKDENKENIEQSDPEIKVDSQGDQEGDDDEARHKEALQALTLIEVEFARLRDKMYQEKMAELNDEAIRVANGTHPDLVASIAELEEKKTKRINSAEAWKEHQYANFKKQSEGFEYQANVHFITQKNALRREVLSGLHDKKWRIEDEHTKHNDSINMQYPDRQQMVAHKQKQKDEMTELRDIRQTVGFPMAPVPTGLCTEDIDEDFRKFGIERHL